MSEGMWMLLLFSGFVIAVGLGLLGWGLRNGQFDDLEAAKFAMLEDREPEPWPAESPGGRHD